MAGRDKQGVLRTTLRLLGAYGRMDINWFLRDTRLCLGYMLTEAVTCAAGAAGVFLLARRFEGVGGLSRHEVLFLLGWAMLAGGLYSVCFANNNAGQPSRIIGRGQLEHAFLQPVPLPLHLLCYGFAPVTGCGPFLFGLGVTVYAGARLGLQTGPGWWLAALGMLLLALVLMTAVMYLVSSLAFWAPFAAEEISGHVSKLFSSLAAYPLGGFGLCAQLALCTALPVGAVAWLPSAVLLGKQPPLAMLLLCAVAAFYLLLSTTIFRKGLKHHAKHSCPRYSGFGR